jgi:hypothetical protein
MPLNGSTKSLGIVLTTGSDNSPAVQVSTTKIIRFCSEHVEKPNSLLLGGPDHEPYLFARGFCPVWLDRLVPLSGFVFRVSQFLMTFRYAAANCTISTALGQYLFWMHMPPWWSKQREIRSLPQDENECQWSVNDCWPRITANQRAKLQILVIYINSTILIR